MEKRVKDIDKQISENKVAAIDAIFGEDIQSAISNFASAYIDAWAGGEDRAKSMKNVVKDMVRSMVLEMAKAEVASSGMMDYIRRQIDEFMGDDRLDDDEIKELERLSKLASTQLDEKYGWLDRLFKTTEQQGAASYGAYEKITQDQASAIDGRLSGIQMSSINIEEQSKLSQLALSAIGVKLDMSNKLLDEIRMHNENIQNAVETMEKAKDYGIVNVLENIKKGTDSLITR